MTENNTDIKKKYFDFDNFDKVINFFSKILNFISNEPIKVGLYFLYLFFILSVLWTFFAKLDSAAVSQGTVVLGSNQKIIQHLEGGIIEKIFVKDGDFVKAGQDLIFLNKISANANFNFLYKDLLAEKANEIRLIAEKNEKNLLNFSNELDYDLNSLESIKIIKTQINLFNSRRTEILNKTEILNSQIEQIREEINGLASQKDATETQLFLIEKEIKVVEKLVEDGYETKTRLYTLQRNGQELRGNIGNFQASISKSLQAINKTKLDIFDIKNERKNDILKELHETQIKINDLESKIESAKDVLDRVIIKTAYSGIVSDMKFYSIGGVIPPHTDIMKITPQNDELIIEAKLNPQDIDVVHVGLNSKVTLSAYKSRYVPSLVGEVIYVAPDKITDPTTKTTYYVIRVKIDESNEKNKKIMKNQNIKLYPGMPAEVFVITGKRTFMKYLTDPVRKTFRRGFREE